MGPSDRHGEWQGFVSAPGARRPCQCRRHQPERQDNGWKLNGVKKEMFVPLSDKLKARV
jgi:hypothetical protein